MINLFLVLLACVCFNIGGLIGVMAVKTRNPKLFNRADLWMGHAAASNALLMIREGGHLPALISSALAAWMYHSWWRNGGGGGMWKRLKKRVRKFTGTRRTAPVAT